jgi:hypothetical protein
MQLYTYETSQHVCWVIANMSWSWHHPYLALSLSISLFRSSNVSACLSTPSHVHISSQAQYVVLGNIYIHGPVSSISCMRSCVSCPGRFDLCTAPTNTWQIISNSYTSLIERRAGRAKTPPEQSPGIRWETTFAAIALCACCMCLCVCVLCVLRTCCLTSNCQLMMLFGLVCSFRLLVWFVLWSWIMCCFAWLLCYLCDCCRHRHINVWDWMYRRNGHGAYLVRWSCSCKCHCHWG